VLINKKPPEVRFRAVFFFLMLQIFLLILSPFPVARNPDSFATVRADPIFPMPRNPNAVITVILVVIAGRIRPMVVISNWRRRGYKHKRWPNKESKVGTAMRVVSVPVPVPGPG
jgi:hypothetical protein